jgi:hypothetical protein
MRARWDVEASRMAPAKPHVEGTVFGSITIDGEVYNHDVVLTPAGKVVERRKELPKRVTGTSHVVSKEEAEYLVELGAERLIIGTGQYGALTLSEEAAGYLREKGCTVTLAPTPEAIEHYNAATEPTTAMFHLTC